jgi:ketopantoate reductase
MRSAILGSGVMGSALGRRLAMLAGELACNQGQRPEVGLRFLRPQKR